MNTRLSAVFITGALMIAGVRTTSLVSGQPTASQPTSLLKSAVYQHNKAVLDINREKYKTRYEANDYAIDGKYRFALADLNDDGLLDALVYFDNPVYCGSGGCVMQIYRGTRTGFEFVSSSTITVLPIRLLTEKRYGWKTLIVGSGNTGNVLMRFSGSRYPANPSLQPKASQSNLDSSVTVSDWTK